MNLIHGRSSVRVDWYRHKHFPRLLFFMANRSHTIAKCEGFQFFWTFLNYLCFLEALVKLGLTRACEECSKLWDATNWCYVVALWCSMISPCVGHVLKRVFGTCFTNETLILCVTIEKKVFHIKCARPNANIICHVMMHPCAKYELIWTMLGHIMINK